MERALKLWKGKYLTMYGKITLINSLMVLQFVHLHICILPSPEPNLLKLYEKKIMFLWSGAPERVKCKTLHNAYNKGGLNQENLEVFDKTLKAAFFVNPNSFCQSYLAPNKILNKSLFPFIQLLPEHFPFVFSKILPLNPFYKDVLNARLPYQFKPLKMPGEIQQEVIWLKSNILVSNKPFL